MFGGLPGLLLLAAPELALSIVDVEDFAAQDLLRLQADLVFEVERHTGLPVRSVPVPARTPVEDAPAGLWVRAFRGVDQVRLILEDRRSGTLARAESEDLDWPLSASRGRVQAMLLRLLGASPLGAEEADLHGAALGPKSREDTSAGPLALLAVGVVAGGVSLGFAGASFGLRDGTGAAELRPEGQSRQAAVYTGVSFLSLGLAGASLLASALWAMAD